MVTEADTQEADELGGVTPHPHVFMAELMTVYEQRIRPAIEKGDMESASIFILDQLMRREFVEQGAVRCNPEAHACYEFATRYLSGLANSPLRNEKRFRDKMLPLINVQLGKMEIILQGDERYESNRQRSQG